MNESVLRREDYLELKMRSDLELTLKEVKQVDVIQRLLLLAYSVRT